jgi:hypothetical protein
MPMITTIDVFRRLGLNPTKDEAWAVGAAVRDRYQEIFGALPPKGLRPKTRSDAGSHCFALYPPEFEPLIEQVIGRMKIARDAQRDLFDGDGLGAAS